MANRWFEDLKKNFPKQYERMQKYGRRNISFSTVAPTGSVSLLTQTTSGIEPLFKPFYKRRKKVNPDGYQVKIDYVDQNGDAWQEFFVLHSKFKDWIRNTFVEQGGGVVNYGYGGWTEEELEGWYKRSPWYGSCAEEIDWRARIGMQHIVQKFTTHSISSTLNLPEDATEEDIKEIYMAAYEADLKGVTVYRDGCRSGVLVSSNDGKDDAFPQHDAPDRPETLPVDVHHLTADGKRWTVLIGLLDEKPYEVFGLEGTIFGKYEKGFVIKEGGGEYSFAGSEDEEAVKEDITADMTVHHEDLTRSWSGALRHGMPVQYLAEQLQKNRKEVTAFSKAIARTLNKYVTEEELLNRAKCDNCGSTDIRREEGCNKCLSCGHSACG